MTTEDTFATINQAGALRSVAVVLLNDLHAHVHYETITGVQGAIHTHRGQPKDYRIDTALKFLRGLGITNVAVDLSKMPAQ